MNYCGSYRRLLGNAKSAMVAAIEIYNKPSFSYRDECFVILVLNAWELALKALLSKKRQSIYYRKKRREPYRTVSWQDGLGKAEKYFPNGLPPHPIRKNLELLGTYRDNAVHFYNEPGFGVLIYALAQTCVKNFWDFLDHAFGVRLEDEISWQLLPLGIQPPIDPLTYISGAARPGSRASSAVRHYMAELLAAVDEVQEAGGDTARLLTVFSVKLESTKKIEKADLIVGVKSPNGTTGPLTVVRVQDPNVTHPLRQRDVVASIGSLHGKPFTTYTFQALAWRFNLKEDLRYCWRATEGVLIRYSHDVVAWVKRLSQSEVKHALRAYRCHLRSRR